MPAGRKPGGPKTGGRTKGQRNKRTRDGEAYARAIVDDDAVRAQLLQQAQAGILATDLMKTLLAYAFGKPSEVVDSAGSETPRSFTIHF